MKPLAVIFLSVFLTASACHAADLTDTGNITMVTEYRYQMGSGDSDEIARALVQFGAKMKAVALAAKYFTHKGVLAHYEKRQHEIYCLVPEEIRTTVLDETFDSQSRSYYLKIQSDISPMDFIKAENEDVVLQEREAGFSFGREMTQPVIGEIFPGRELSRAYRYIRKGEWRVAIIYLDHLEKKYPNWGDVPLAKAIALYSSGDAVGMKSALENACRLGTPEACDELKSFGLD